MFKKLVLILVLFSLCFSLFALDTLDMSKAEPYRESEFPKWSLDLRRSEIIFFGSLPLAYPVVSLALSTLGKPSSFMETLPIACSVSAVIALADYIIGLYQ